METVLLQFIDTLDTSLKAMQAQLGENAGMGKLTISQLHYIDAIHTLGRPTASELAEHLAITRASVTAGINKLAGMGYVLKTPSTEDRRVVHLSLTDNAQALVSAKYAALQRYGDFIRSALSEQEAHNLTAILTKLVTLFAQNTGINPQSTNPPSQEQ
ncbi:MAG: MarR family transcriptional regulator [Anaerolineae bacterium]|nr:MarR family transcriptional regulator [Anaerolineae bacterium]